MSLLHRADATALRILREQHVESLAMSAQTGPINYIKKTFKDIVDTMPDRRNTFLMLVTLCTFFVGWRTAIAVTDCESPLVVVLSGSMEPFMFRGDLLVLHNIGEPTMGDVVVFSLPNRTIPIVHRVHRIRLLEDGVTRLYLTKGDNNEMDDRTLYPRGYHWVEKKDIIGKVAVLVPRVGFITLIAEDHSWAKLVLVPLALIWCWYTGM
ncbi:signal peptidase type I, putative [Trypanosoma equiperdum]|uniref:Signal peptidase complex catalytic subunit SEC11 n=4 Tax=Trypanozoon TaxID=39700 RepID=Q57Z71_TRYB2|nr:serine peptidase, Clan SF, Family S26A [Trypanosoma brucei gambiense DAL972]XP_844994.1 signal peptidase type I, putative [Trypanosoma brucei brucei TREU927]AAX79562.1 signal peptidase type I, putative [Trypanosoma brucei]RHW72409.1 signal peptidase type I [Trypanosoma brucei equiperdum]SCU65107.1 signal peptidase type I, putative [Trypanosoma equiperdum]AAZ11435.1 signal peptidase type I, putative [Trypanosoma brucei brucei TREU927]CBH11310.1 serine peptidase, Clan SF, Family S26A [Trypan|eukprot:XP_011773597.1 serine peptidase, Clan SF, Family S26A [Trypanosoma brucei gambiense DAL972]